MLEAVSKRQSDEWRRSKQFNSKIGCHGKIKNLRPNTYHFVKNWMKISPVDPDIIGLQEIIKKERN